ncbi:hypothetical protein MMC15_001368 [Xylographa vitiligo]|nr:hypothetical protein [Xylographa vitiligo]
MVREGKSRLDPAAERAEAVQNGHVAGAGGMEGRHATRERGEGESTSAGTPSGTTPSRPNPSQPPSNEPQLSLSKPRSSSPTARRRHAAKAASTTTSAPILVNPSPFPTMATTSSPRPSKHPHHSASSRHPSHALPPLSAFSFADILASIDMDVKAEIDSIAEICGRSKLSLANEYGSHLPPHGERLLGENGDTSGPELGGVEQRGLEVVEESAESLGHGSLEASASASGEDGEGGGPRGWGAGARRVGVGRAVARVSEGVAIGVVGDAEGEQRDRGSLAVRHLQALTRVGS